MTIVVDERRLEKKDLLAGEIDPDQEYFMEMTRYTTMNKMINEGLVSMITQLTKEEIGSIMLLKNWIEAYEIVMEKADNVSKRIAMRTLRTTNAKRNEILNLMKLKVVQDGWRSKQMFDTLLADEKTGKRFGFDIFRRADEPPATGAP